ncbi:MAG: beta-1,6-N-acetylglucosaminyltransferase [Bacteroidales bacterium]|nr:beta-1,6-N-acetylglucosaminyltransferase [Bacteroidales bacterium]MCM1416521.1 beta-1,6-N-acetylglucosaminyltransferase [bacterium]MCM1424499.1 beta-1,6-N-acetylglucosaminyltransferase [bacterium]
MKTGTTDQRDECSRKHAYLIEAHKDDDTFYTLLRLLDNSRNDIFIHMDLKNRKYRPEKAEQMISHANVIHTQKRLKVQWGGYSVVEAELILLSEAVSVNHYAYYHLLSGQDLPIQSQDAIHRFFDDHSGKEFVRIIDSESAWHRQIGRRVGVYHLFQEYLGRKHKILRAFNNVFLSVQQMLGIKRSRDVDFRGGAQWFSITDSLARYVLGKSAWIRKTFANTCCADEIFLQTIVYHSEFADKLYQQYDGDAHANMRLIDWKRGDPYIFREADQQELFASDLLFARKFDCAVDRHIVESVYLLYKDLFL